MVPVLGEAAERAAAIDRGSHSYKVWMRQSPSLRSAPTAPGAFPASVSRCREWASEEAGTAWSGSAHGSDPSGQHGLPEDKF